MSPHAAATALAGAFDGLVREFEGHGLDRAEILRATGVSQKILADPDARVPSSSLWKLWRFGIGRLGDIDLGLECARGLHARGLGLVGYMMLFSQTSLQALRRLSRYSRILNETLRYKLEEERFRIQVALEREPRFDPLRHPIDLRLGGILTVLKEICGSPLLPVEVHLSYPRPHRTSGLAQFFGAPLHFGMRESRLVFRRADLERAVPAADPRLAEYLEDLAKETLQRSGDQGTLPDRVRRTIWTDLADGAPSVARVASSLGLSARSLQRRLEQERTSFSSVVEGLRRELALSLLMQRELAISEVGFLLGYSDPAAFHRAFRRWTSRSPRQYRAETAKAG